MTDRIARSQTLARFDMPTPPKDLVVRRIRGMGRGVFADRAFRRGEVIEVCPVLHLPSGTPPDGLEHYVFKWGADGKELAVALGYGSLYNHSPTPNATFTTRYARAEVVFRATRVIAAGEQILIDYRWDESEYGGFA